jgi:hypothetical protein
MADPTNSNFLVILHGTHLIEEQCIPLSIRYRLPYVLYRDWNGEKGFIVYGPLYIAVDGYIRPTVLQAYIEDADVVCNSSCMCAQCGNTHAKILLDDMHLCLSCANCIVHSRPPVLSYRGSVDVIEGLATVTLHNAPISRMSKCGSVAMSVASAIIGVDTAIGGPSKRVYHLTYPTFMSETSKKKIDDILCDASNHNVRIVWE